MTSPGPHYLRLFSLGSVVLFPGMELPLHVFEPRYRQLVKECMEEDISFGVLLLQSGSEVGDAEAQPFQVGTTARIHDPRLLSDGRLALLATGERRFRVTSFGYDKPYLSAQVEYLKDEPSTEVPEPLIQRVRDVLGAYVQGVARLRGGWVRTVELPETPSELSFTVARVFEGNPGVQQGLLEAPTAAARLTQELELLDRAHVHLEELIGRQRTDHQFHSN